MWRKVRGKAAACPEQRIGRPWGRPQYTRLAEEEPHPAARPAVDRDTLDLGLSRPQVPPLSVEASQIREHLYGAGSEGQVQKGCGQTTPDPDEIVVVAAADPTNVPPHRQGYSAVFRSLDDVDRVRPKKRSKSKRKKVLKQMRKFATLSWKYLKQGFSSYSHPFFVTPEQAAKYAMAFRYKNWHG